MKNNLVVTLRGERILCVLLVMVLIFLTACGCKNEGVSSEKVSVSSNENLSSENQNAFDEVSSEDLSAEDGTASDYNSSSEGEIGNSSVSSGNEATIIKKPFVLQTKN